MASCAHELECAAGVSSRVHAHAGVHLVPPDSRAPPARRDINVHVTRTWRGRRQGRAQVKPTSSSASDSGRPSSKAGSLRKRVVMSLAAAEEERREGGQ